MASSEATGGRHGRELGGDVLVYGIAGALTGLIRILIVPLLTRSLSQPEYGLFALTGTVGATLVVLVLAGIDGGIARTYYAASEGAERDRVVSTGWWFLVGGGLVWTGLLALLARPLNGLLFRGELSGLAYGLLLAGLGPTAWLGYLINLFKWSRIRGRFVALSLLTAGLYTALALLAVWRGWGVEGLLGTQAVAAVVTLGVGLTMLRGRLGSGFDRTVLRSTLAVSLPLVAITLGDQIVLGLAPYAVLYQRSAADVALYNVAFRPSAVVSILMLGVQTAYVPFAFRIEREPGARATIARSFTTVSLAVAAAVVALTVGRGALTVLFAPPAYRSAADLVPILAAAAGMIQLFYLVNVGSLLAGRTGAFFSLYAVVLPLTAGLAWGLTGAFGLIGAALATLGATATLLALGYAAAQRRYPIPYPLGRLARLAGLTAAAVGLALRFDPLGQPLATLAVGLGWLVGLPLVGVVDRSDLVALRSLMGRP